MACVSMATVQQIILHVMVSILNIYERDCVCTTDLLSDINECSLNSSICGSGICVNLIGSYTCNCTVGYRFNGQTCIGECDFFYTPDNMFLTSCYKDIDECSEPNVDGSFPRRCNLAEVCTNTIGNYTCACSVIFNTTGTCVCTYTSMRFSGLISLTIIDILFR